MKNDNPQNPAMNAMKSGFFSTGKAYEKNEFYQENLTQLQKHYGQDQFAIQSLVKDLAYLYTEKEHLKQAKAHYLELSRFSVRQWRLQKEIRRAGLSQGLPP